MEPETQLLVFNEELAGAPQRTRAETDWRLGYTA